MKKAVLLAPTPPPMGGIAQWTVRYLASPLKNDWRLELVDEKVIGGREAFGAGSERSLLTEAKRCFGIWRRLSRALRDPEARLAHSCIPAEPGAMLRELVCCAITHLHRKAFLIHFRCTVPNMASSGVRKMLLKRLCRRADRIIVLNRQSEQFVKALTRKPVETIPNFVCDAEFNASRQIREQAKTCLYVGGGIESKGIGDVIEVAKMLPELTFRIVGRCDPAYLEQLRKEGPGNVICTGVQPHDAVRAELENADIFLFLTYYPGEGFSNALAEAMASGLPCVVTDWAANADMISDGGGAVVPVRDPRAAADAIRSLLPYEVRCKQSQWNVQKVKTHYSQETIIDRYVDLYERCGG